MSTEPAPHYPFDRPIIIVSAPRSGSTLLFETLCRAEAIWTIGDESHMVFEHIRKLNPAYGECASNRLVADDADPATLQRVRDVFFSHLRNHDGQLFSHSPVANAIKPRLLEKTPKNALRIPFLNEVFPDAVYIYLFRDPRENLSSMIEAWRSSDFVTYAGLPEWPGNWSLLLPPDYQRMRGTSLEEIVAFQWQAANQTILDDLARLPDERWTAVSYAELVADSTTTIQRLCEFADIEFDAGLKTHCASALPLSRYTKSTPQKGKWRKNEAMIERVLPGLRPLIADIGQAVAPHSDSGVLLSGPIGDPQSAPEEGPRRVQGRNDRCDCGSGLRYKHCHGKI